MIDRPLPERRIRQHLRTIASIASAPSVERYVIGYSSQSSWKRFGQYRASACSHLVVIAEGLKFSQALMLESLLQTKAWQDERTVLFKKYDPTRRDKKGFYGAPAPKWPHGPERENDPIHLVYMAWWERSPKPRLLEDHGGEHTNTP